MIDIFTGGPSAPRPAGDILSRVVRITLGGQQYELPVRSIAANRDWKAALDAKTSSLVAGLDSSGDDLAAILGMLGQQVGDLIDLLLSYDTASVLPSKDEIEAIEPDASVDVVAAVREVWRAANPLVVTTLATLMETIASETPTNGSSLPTSSPPASTTGRRKRSRAS